MVLVHYLSSLVDFLVNFGESSKPARLVTASSERDPKKLHLLQNIE